MMAQDSWVGDNNKNANDGKARESGPFPNFDPLSGPSQLLMATPVSPGATVIAVPSGPPPASIKQPPSHALPRPGGPAFHPVQPHMLHWDCQHPGGQMVPLRQPVPPVYYNVQGDQNSSGLQSPNSEGSGSISESSSTSGDQEVEGGNCLYLQHSPGYQPVNHMMGLHRHVQGGGGGQALPPPAFCHQLGQAYMPPHHGGPPHFPLYNQVFITQ